VVGLAARANWRYDLHVTTPDGLDQHIEVRSGQALTARDVRLTDVNGDGHLDLLVVGGKDHRGEDWFKTWLYDASGKKYTWVDGEAPPPPPPDAGASRGLAEAEAQNKVLWQRLAAAAIRKFLEPPERKDLAALVAERLASPLEYMEVVSPGGTAGVIEHLRGAAELQHTAVPKADPEGAVVVYLKGPKGGSWRVGVVFDRADGTAKSVVFVPGK
jgi:hypothetical protein